MKNMAKNLNVGKLWTKDESKRFDLNAYKFLGVSYSLALELAKDHNVKGIFYHKIQCFNNLTDLNFDYVFFFRFELGNTPKTCFRDGNKAPFDYCNRWKSWICPSFCSQITWL